MSRSKGKKSNTRYILTKSKKLTGIKSNIIINNVSIGDLVDIVIDPSFQSTMPFKFYHGKTGEVFSLNSNSLGIKIQKIVGNRKVCKKINIGLEHLRISKSNFFFEEKIKSKTSYRKNTSLKNIVFKNYENCDIYSENYVSFSKIKKN